MHLELPDQEDELIQWLIDRGRMHFPRCPKAVLKEAANQLWTDRAPALKQGLPAPGQAEYLDILRALTGIGGDKEEQLGILEKISGFALRKYPEETTQ